jgi:hypothetical protein
VARLRADLGAGYRLTDWLSERTADCPQKNQASITHATAQQMMVRGLIEPQAATRSVLSEQGRAVLAVLLR